MCFCAPCIATPIANPKMVHFNSNVCELLELTHSPELEQEVLGYCSGLHIIPQTRPFATQSHLRFGHFEYFYYTKQDEALNQLLQFVINELITDEQIPELHTHQNPAHALFLFICQNTATLLAKWQSCGFQHGVMNTDNMSILGLTLDYGPFAFMDDFDYFSVCNYSDHTGRYGFDQQPSVAAWNLQALGQVFSHWLNIDAIKEGIELYRITFEETYLSLMHKKLGLFHTQSPEIIYSLMSLLHQHKIDYICFFRHLCDFSWPIQNPFLESCQQKSRDFHQWFANYHEKRAQPLTPSQDIKDQMRAVNPCYILRNYLAHQAIAQAETGDFSELERLMSVLQNPFTEQAGQEKYAEPAPSWGKQLAISCSS